MVYAFGNAAGNEVSFKIANNDRQKRGREGTMVKTFNYLLDITQNFGMSACYKVCMYNVYVVVCILYTLSDSNIIFYLYQTKA